jgi:hypothetical protein
MIPSLTREDTLSAILSSCIKAIRNLPQDSALNGPLRWMRDHKLLEGSIIYPTIDLTNEDKIQQTASRLFFAFILPSLAKPFGYANLGLGATHFVWCICNIRKIQKREEGYHPQEVEKALIRIFTGVYDLAIGYLLHSSIMNSLIGRSSIPIAFALFPSYPIQLHHLIFEKGVKTITEGKEGKTIVDDQVLKVGCLIKQFCSGLVLTFLPEPEAPKGIGARLWALPSALGTFGQNTWSKVWWTK